MTQPPDSATPDTEISNSWPSSSAVVDSPVIARRSRGDRRAAVAVVSCVILAAVVVIGARLVSSDHEAADVGPSATSVSVRSSKSSTAAGRGLDVAKVVSSISPSVVKVSVDINGTAGSGEGVGTGLIISADGEIVTNAHVVVDAAAVRVLLPGSTEPITAQVIGTDSGNDLALLQVKGSGLPVARFAPKDSAQVGDQVVAMGFALDLPGEASVTSGIISALSRTMLTQTGALNGLLQTDAAISSGNSGGPLLNSSGEVIGINTAVARSSAVNTASNIGFAISSKEIQKVVEQLRTTKGGSRVEGFLGVRVDDRVDGGRGAIVSRVIAGSPADHLGIKEGDMIRKVNGEVTEGQAGLIASIRDLSPGDSVTLEYVRAGKTIVGTVRLETRPKN